MDLISNETEKPNMDELSTRKKILLAAIGFIEREGVHAVTTRAIAKEADVNSAAINYYFGTKEKLIEETLNFTAGHLLSDMDEMLESGSADIKDLLKKFLFYYLKGSLEYPGLLKAYFDNTSANNSQDNSLTKMFIDNVNKIIVRLSEHKVGKDAEEKIMLIMQMIASSLFPAFMPEMFDHILGKGFTKDIDKQKKYVELLVDKFFCN